MTAPVSHADFAFALLASGEREQVAAMWRGAMLDRFAFAEAKAIDCIQVLRDTRRLQGTLAELGTGWERFTRIASVVGLAEFGSQGRKMEKLLGEMRDLRDLRNALAHGQLAVSASGITLQWREIGHHKLAPRKEQVPWPLMLEHLVTLDKLARDLASQLGNLCKRMGAPKDGAKVDAIAGENA